MLGVIDSLTAERIDPAIAGAASAWRDLERIASEFSFGQTAPEPDIIAAGEDVRLRFSSIASPASRAEDVDVLGTFTSHLATSMGLTAAARDLVDERELLAPARAINRLLRDVPRSEHLGSIVSAADIHQGRAISLPQPAREAISVPLNLAYRASAEAIRRSAAFDPIYRSGPRTGQGSSPSRRTQPVGIDRRSSPSITP